MDAKNDVLDEVMGTEESELEIDDLEVEESEADEAEVEESEEETDDQEAEDAESEESDDQESEESSDADAEGDESEEVTDEMLLDDLLADDDDEAAETDGQSVPLPVFLDYKKRSRELERSNNDLRQRLDRLEGSRQADTGQRPPTTMGELIEAGILDPDETPTAEHFALIEKNRMEVESLNSQQTAQQQSQRAISDFALSITPRQEAFGLGIDDVLVPENVENLTQRDIREVQQMPIDKRPLEMYRRTIAKTPKLYKRYQQFAAKTGKSKTTITKTKTPAKKTAAKKRPAASVTQKEILESETDVRSLLLGPE